MRTLLVGEDPITERGLMKNLLFRSGVILLLLSLSGCGGTKVLKEPEPLAVTQSLSTASDKTLSATLDWVIVRDGPGTWAKNVDWDEYLIRVQNLGEETIKVTNIVIVDSLGLPIDTGENRRQLVKGTKQTKRRYKHEGLEVKAGANAGVMLVAGAVTGAAGVALGTAVALGGSGVMVGAAVGGLLFAPVLAVGGVLRGVNNSKVNSQIEMRQTILPVELEKEEGKNIDVFFPLSPSPRRVELTYVDSRGNHTLVVDTRDVLDGLHLAVATR